MILKGNEKLESTSISTSYATALENPPRTEDSGMLVHTQQTSFYIESCLKGKKGPSSRTQNEKGTMSHSSLPVSFLRRSLDPWQTVCGTPGWSPWQEMGDGSDGAKEELKDRHPGSHSSALLFPMGHKD